jgi:hypothetical protein
MLRELQEHVGGVGARTGIEVVVGGEPDALERAPAVEPQAVRRAREHRGPHALEVDVQVEG